VETMLLSTYPGVDFFCQTIFLSLDRLVFVREMCILPTSKITGNWKLELETFLFSINRKEVADSSLSVYYLETSVSKVINDFTVAKCKEYFSRFLKIYGS
jgi:hypothetical protein